jgi:hypothetical protein
MLLIKVLRIAANSDLRSGGLVYLTRGTQPLVGGNQSLVRGGRVTGATLGRLVRVHGCTVPLENCTVVY